MTDKKLQMTSILQDVVHDDIQKDFELTETVFAAVKEKLLIKIEEELDKNHKIVNIITNIRKLLPAIVQGEKILANYKETVKSEENSNATKEVVEKEEKKEEDEDDEEDFVAKLKKSGKTAKKKDDSKTKYFLYLSEYKKDEDMLERVKGLQLRGKSFRVSNDGSCPKCRYRSNVFVILDLLFLDNDMPEMLQYLLQNGKACLWSSKDDYNCKDPPTFLCGGRCPADIKKSGFNINWETTDLEKIFLFPETNYVEKEVKKPKRQPQSTEIKEDPPIEEVQTAPEVLKTDEDPKEKEESVTCEEENKGHETEETPVEATVSKEEENTQETKPPEIITEEQVEIEKIDWDKVDVDFYHKAVSWVVLDEEVEEKDLLSECEQDLIRGMMMVENVKEDIKLDQLKIKPIEEVVISDDEETNPPLPSEETNSVSKEDQVSSKTNVNTAFLEALRKSNETLTVQNKSPESSASSESDVVMTASIEQPGSETPVHVLKEATYYEEKSKAKVKVTFTAADFPISKDGACPYCHSKNVVYIIIDEKRPDEQLPELLSRLKDEGHAKLMPKANYDLPSFQCNGCTYGFNLDWSKTNLEKIFPKPTKPKPPPVAAAQPYANPYQVPGSYYYGQAYPPGAYAAWGYNPMQGFAVPMFPPGGMTPYAYPNYPTVGMVDPRYQQYGQSYVNQANWPRAQQSYPANTNNTMQNQISSAPPVEEPVEKNKPSDASNSTESTNAEDTEKESGDIVETSDKVKSSVENNSETILEGTDDKISDNSINNSKNDIEIMEIDGVSGKDDADITSETNPTAVDSKESDANENTSSISADVTLVSDKIPNSSVTTCTEKSIDVIVIPIDDDDDDGDNATENNDNIARSENTVEPNTSEKNNGELENLIESTEDTSSKPELAVESNNSTVGEINEELNEKSSTPTHQKEICDIRQVVTADSGTKIENKRRTRTSRKNSPSKSNVLLPSSAPEVIDLSGDQSPENNKEPAVTDINSRKRELETTSNDSPPEKKRPVDVGTLNLSLDNDDKIDGISSIDEVSEYIMDETTLKENKQMWSNDTETEVDSPFTDLLVNIMSDIVETGGEVSRNESSPGEQKQNNLNVNLTESEEADVTASSLEVTSEEQKNTEEVVAKKSTRGRPKGATKRGRGRGRGRKKK